MKAKPIKSIYKANQSHMVGDGFKVFTYFPNEINHFRDVSPFLLLDYNAPYHFPPTTHRKGVGAHPHKGFETVTIVFEGYLEHRDSAGGGGMIGPGDVQWMTAASGLLHDEFQPEDFSKNGGVLHAIQLWVNLPAKDKLSKPKYQTLLKDNIKSYKEGKGVNVRVIAGVFKGVQGLADTFTPIELYDIQLTKDATLNFELPTDYNAMLLITKGNIRLNDKETLDFKEFASFEREGESIHLTANEDSRIMVLSGEPINEPVANYGPFVMNTQKEIMEAVEEFNAGKFGQL